MSCSYVLTGIEYIDQFYIPTLQVRVCGVESLAQVYKVWGVGRKSKSEALCVVAHRVRVDCII